MPERAPTSPHRYLTVVLHDVAPANWAACLRVMTQIQAQARAAGVRVPITLLVVPALHGNPATPAFVRWLHELAHRGHELALHGLTHTDDAPLTGGWRDRLLRRWYTAGEGEFAALGEDEAAQRLSLARAWARALHLPVRGFVAPAWLLSGAAWRAVEAAGFAYTCTLAELVAWPGRRRLHARSIVFSTRSRWRRLLSIVWNTLLARTLARSRLLRLELHPADVDHPAVRRCWTRILAQALCEQHRKPLRLDEAAGRLRPHPPPYLPGRAPASSAAYSLKRL
ncbi:polysaccharide deacetylase family protein [Ideonella sp.]|uniref:polysaccharide deacetylase family protein n=1 Tax=Ideonella sp. TaxID=1929293 RepID=UPI002B472CD2|nr:polysaccharide deacetylase family protein [Ideonella sp.]HJV71317.1 polysaccharide deacetylase family protein [Ideonella sp.]